MRPLLFHAGLGKHIALHTQAFAVEEKLDRVAVGEADDWNDLAFFAVPVPVRRKMQHGFLAPDALIEVVAVLWEAAGIDDA